MGIEVASFAENSKPLILGMTTPQRKDAGINKQPLPLASKLAHTFK